MTIYKMSKYKYRAFSQTSINFSAVFLASIVLPILFDFDNFSWFILIFGVTGVIVFIVFALEFAEKGKL